jgi:hypothetical protein
MVAVPYHNPRSANDLARDRDLRLISHALKRRLATGGHPAITGTGRSSRGIHWINLLASLA